VYPHHHGSRSSVALSASAPILDRDGRALEWHSHSLAINGRWRSRCEAVERTLFASPEGEVLWSCHLPGARADIQLADGTSRMGLGYAEHLSLTIPPWRLPITELRWGRFLSEFQSLVWLDWQGAAPLRLAFSNGVAVTVDQLSDIALHLTDGSRLLLNCADVLRSGALGMTVLRAIPALAKVAPARMLAMEETKWLSRAVLTSPGGREEHGWSIHEVVRWPDH
jgi:hypothetical protein